MMSSRTFFRYFASKEEVLFGPMREVLSDGLRFLQHVAPTEPPHAALRATFLHLADLFQQQRASFLLRYQVAMQIPSVVPIYLAVLIETELALCDVLCAHLEAGTSRQEMHFLVALYMTALRVALQATSQTGTRLTVHFTGNNLVYWLQAALEGTDLIPQLPPAIYHIRQHDYTLLSQSYGPGINTLPGYGLFYSVLCGEDMAFITQHDLEISVQGLPPPIRPALLDFGVSEFAVCQFWGMKAVPAVQKKSVASSIPTLILQGEYDPVTPPANGMLAAKTLSKSYFFLFPGVGHGVTSASPSYICANEIMSAFLDNPTEKPDASCIPPEPNFE